MRTAWEGVEASDMDMLPVMINHAAESETDIPFFVVGFLHWETDSGRKRHLPGSVCYL